MHTAQVRLRSENGGLTFTKLGILIWRIWGASKDGHDTPSKKQFHLLIRILMESGILYLTFGLVHFSLWFTGTDFAIFFIEGMVGLSRNHFQEAPPNNTSSSRIHL